MEWKWNRNGMKMDWFRVLMWIATIMFLTALAGERFLPQIVTMALMVAGTAIFVAIVWDLMDDKE